MFPCAVVEIACSINIEETVRQAVFASLNPVGTWTLPFESTLLMRYDTHTSRDLARIIKGEQPEGVPVWKVPLNPYMAVPVALSLGGSRRGNTGKGLQILCWNSESAVREGRRCPAASPAHEARIKIMAGDPTPKSWTRLMACWPTFTLSMMTSPLSSGLILVTIKKAVQC